MKSINDGGAAFPTQNGCKSDSGMTLRDWFAGMALQGYLAGRNNNRAENPFNFEAIKCAKDCYGYADAMLVARERKEDA